MKVANGMAKEALGYACAKIAQNLYVDKSTDIMISLLFLEH